MENVKNIVRSNNEPSTRDLWLHDGVLEYFGSNGWEPLLGGGGGANVNAILLENGTSTRNLKEGKCQEIPYAEENLSSVTSTLNALLKVLKDINIIK